MRSNQFGVIFQPESNLRKQREFLDGVAKELQFTNFDDWYRITVKDIERFGGRNLLSKYGDSPIKLLTTVYPDHNWLPWQFSCSPMGYWSQLTNQRTFMEWVAKQLNIKEMSDWYKVSTQDFQKFCKGLFANQYSSSPYKLLSSVFPEYEWLPWRFSRVPKGFWPEITNQRKFVQWAAKQLNVQHMSDWYKITGEDIKSVGGLGLLSGIHGGSIFSLLVTVYPEYKWEPWRFKKMSSTFWQNVDHQIQFVNTIEKELNIKDQVDWYKVSPQKIIDLGGGYLLVKYQSLANFLSHIFPKLEWDENRFSPEQQTNIWKNKHLASYFVEWLKRQDEEEIAFIQQEVFKKIKETDNELTNALSLAFPLGDNSKYNKKSQYFLKNTLQQIFNVEVMQDYRHSDISDLELDFYYPQYKLAFEYQGEQHYKNISLFHQKGSFEQNQLRDKLKSDICKENGITLILVPYWWDRKLSSLAATIYNYRPELFSEKPLGEAIPIIRPNDKITTTTKHS